MSRRPNAFVTWSTVAVYLGIPLLMACAGLAFLVWLYGFH